MDSSAPKPAITWYGILLIGLWELTSAKLKIKIKEVRFQKQMRLKFLLDNASDFYAMPRYIKSDITDWHEYMCIDLSVGYSVYRAVS